MKDPRSGLRLASTKASGKKKVPASDAECEIQQGPTPSLQLLGGLESHLPDDQLSESDMKTVDYVHASNRTELRRITNELYDEALDDAWYETSQSAHIACLSSVGIAEYAMRCLNRDIKRYNKFICRLHEMRDRDMRMIQDINTARTVAIDNQKLVDRLHRERIDADQAARSLTREQRLNEANPTNSYYSSAHLETATRGMASTSPGHYMPPYPSQGSSFRDSVTSTGLGSQTPWQSSPPSASKISGNAGSAGLAQRAVPQLPSASVPFDMLHDTRAGESKALHDYIADKKRKAEQKALRCAAKRAKTTNENLPSVPSEVQVAGSGNPSMHRTMRTEFTESSQSSIPLVSSCPVPGDDQATGAITLAETPAAHAAHDSHSANTEIEKVCT